MTPDDGHQRQRAVRDSNRVREVTENGLRTAFFPVSRNQYGDADAYAVEFNDSVTGDTYFSIHQPGIDRAYVEFPAHEMTGPLPAQWAAERSLRVPGAIVPCSATTQAGTPCKFNTDHLSGLCGHHRPRIDGDRA